jgi:hypothetical protein
VKEKGEIIWLVVATDLFERIHNWKVVRKIFNLFFLTGILVLLSFFSTKNANESCARADVKDY